MKSKGEKRAKYEKDFKKIFSKEEIEILDMKNVFFKTKIKSIFYSNFHSYENNGGKNNIPFENFEMNEYDKNHGGTENKNKMYAFSKYSENKIIGEKFYEYFLNLFDYSNDFPEDIEISIYDNFKEENKYGDINISIVKEIIYDLIKNEESEKGFLSLLRQSFLLGKLRSNIVSSYLILFLFYRKKNLLLVYLVRRKQENQHL